MFVSVCNIFVTILTCVCILLYKYVTICKIILSQNHWVTFHQLCHMPHSIGPPWGLCPAGPIQNISLSSHMLATQILKGRDHRPPAPPLSFRLTTPIASEVFLAHARA